jgi:rubredoxin
MEQWRLSRHLFIGNSFRLICAELQMPESTDNGQQTTDKLKGGDCMPSWKCSNCGYTLEADAHPNECPSCKEKCEFLDNTCYTPDCAYEGKDNRIGKKG